MEDLMTHFDRPTVPAKYTVVFKGDFDPDAADKLAKAIGNYLKEVSKDIDLRNLDGITVATDYHQALAELDRGYETSHVLQATTGTAIGIAMTPSVLRDGKIKSHIIFNFGYIAQIALPDDEFHPYAVHTLAHEAAHVEVTAAFDNCFPGILLKPRMMSLGNHRLDEIKKACWEEYAVCRLAACFGADPAPGQIDVFLGILNGALTSGNTAIKEFRTHGDNDRLLDKMIDVYGNLMKFASYVIGTLDGSDRSIDDFEKLSAALKGNWFEFYFFELQRETRNIWSKFGRWEDEAEFSSIAELGRLMIADSGVQIIEEPGYQTRLLVPLLNETVPLSSAVSLKLFPSQTFKQMIASGKSE